MKKTIFGKTINVNVYKVYEILHTGEAVAVTREFEDRKDAESARRRMWRQDGGRYEVRVA